MVKTWASSTKAMPHDWLQLITAVLENGRQLLWKYYCREEAKILEQQGKANRLETSPDQIFAEGHYSDPQEQACYNKHTLFLCSGAALNAWDKIQELEKGTE